MILILGGNGYIGRAFQRFLTARGETFRSISRSQVDYSDPAQLRSLIESSGATFLINAAGYTGKPNVDACEIHRADCLQGNAVLPGRIRQACEATELPWGHVSSGCIYSGRRRDGEGFRETDPPNFCFRTNHCSFYSGCKALGEEVLDGAQSTYIWRLRIPFDQFQGDRNYLSKLLRYDQLLDAENSITHLGDFVRCCYQSWQQRIPFGTYHVTNTGSVTTRRVVELIQRELNPDRSFRFFEDEAAFMKVAAKTPRSNCVLDNRKLRTAGIEIRPIEDAIVDALRNWTVVPEAQAAASR